jgi:peptidoglycan L-alanyl-D-glutamate endopeptidase CwlK
MAYKFGKTSLQRLSTCDSRIQLIMSELIKIMDVTVLEGHRTSEQHAINIKNGATKVPYEKSKHSTYPSNAIDIAPWPIPTGWGSSGSDGVYSESEQKERAKFYYMAGLVLGISQSLGISLRWGGDWNGNNSFDDQRFDDLVHFELKED